MDVYVLWMGGDGSRELGGRCAMGIYALGIVG